MIKVLIITYYWAPSGGSGVQRWLKFVKYFRDFGIEPVVYTPENPEMMLTDHTLISEIPGDIEIVKHKIFEPYGLYKAFIGKKNDNIKPGFVSDGKKSSWKERLSLLIRSNLFVPDPKCLWINPSVRFLKRYIAENRIDVIISTGPPHSMHLIAAKVAKSTGVKWIADFRDPWTKMYNFDLMKYSRGIKALHRRYEKRVVSMANAVVVVTDTMYRCFKALNPKLLALITNGYDESDFYNSDILQDKNFSITYTGLFLKMQNPAILWNVLGEKASIDPVFKRDLQIKLIGTIDSSIIDSITKAGLADNLCAISYVSHEEAIRYQQSAQILLLCGGRSEEAKGILTGKFFEYIASRRRILAFCSKDSDIAGIMQSSGMETTFDYEETGSLRVWIEERYAEYKNGGVCNTAIESKRFSRRKLTEEMALLINQVVR